MFEDYPPSGSSWLERPLAALGRRGTAIRPPFRGGRRFLIVHLDGVSREVLGRAIGAGYMPWLAGAIERGEYGLAASHAGTPASTPAFQSSLFYGDHGDLPGFIWHDKRRGKDVRMDDAAEVLRLEESIARPGLLAGGSTYFSIVSGGASEPAFCTSRLARDLAIGGPDEKNLYDHAASAIAHALPVVRGLAKFAGTAASGAISSARWAIEQRRLRHEPRFVIHRALLGELLAEFATHLTLLDLSRGVPAIYTVYAGYDEIAHRRGPFSEEALAELRVADDALALLHAAIKARPERRYEMYVLSDHGQEPTRPIERVLAGPNLADWILAADRRGGVDPARVKRIARDRLRRERLEAVPFFKRLCGGASREGGGEENRPKVIVSEAGDVAHVYFTDRTAPLTFEEMEARWPAQLRAVLECPASGIVAIRGGSAGFAFLQGKRFDLSDPGALEGVLRYDGTRLRSYLLEMLQMPSAGDLVVYGAGVPGGDVAYAFEFGSHGGVGAGDVETFFIHPWHVPVGDAQMGPRELHAFFRERFVPEYAAKAPTIATLEHGLHDGRH
ncbi:alkaline phosphatase family protein [Vulgatibacter sp.]|uniref:alkaline phosphatase family protein n=1 Tax=Vulgatibacter sp. TaxID=1971226 RepID=UPI003566A4AF